MLKITIQDKNGNEDKLVEFTDLEITEFKDDILLELFNDFNDKESKLNIYKNKHSKIIIEWNE